MSENGAQFKNSQASLMMAMMMTAPVGPAQH
jgi:hypothetical protein